MKHLVKLILLILIVIGQASTVYSQTCPTPPVPFNSNCSTGPREFATDQCMKWTVGSDAAHPYQWEANTITKIDNQNNPITTSQYILNPFLHPDYPNWGANDNSDLIPLRKQDISKLDYQRLDGWELITKTIGNATTGSYIKTPIWVFYNKYTSVLRIFANITEALNEGYNTGTICLYYDEAANGSSSGNELQSTLNPATPLDKFVEYRKNANQLCAAFNRPAEDNQWAYAEFPMLYDPCSCHISELGTSFMSKIHVEVRVVSSSTLTGRLVPTDGTQADPSAGASMGSSGGGSNVFNSFKEAIKGTAELLETASKIPDPFKKVKTTEELNKMELAGNLLSLVPEVGQVSSSVIDIIDMFSGSTSESATTGVMILNDFALSGTITQSSLKKNISFDVPGTNINSTEIAYKNNLGNFSLNYTPQLKIKRGASNDACGYNFSAGSLGATSEYEDFFVRLDQPLNFSVNPALGFDIAKSTFSASIELDLPRIRSDEYCYWTTIIGIPQEICTNHGFDRWDKEYGTKKFGAFNYKGSTDLVATVNSYYRPFECMVGENVRLRLSKEYLSIDGHTYAYDWRKAALDNNQIFSANTMKFYVKIIINLVHPSGKNYNYIARYPATYTFEGPSTSCPTTSEQSVINSTIIPYYSNPQANSVFEIPSDIEVSFNGTSYNYTSLHSATIVSDIISPSTPVVIRSANIIVNPGVTLEGNVTLEQVDLTGCSVPKAQPVALSTSACLQLYSLNPGRLPVRRGEEQNQDIKERYLVVSPNPADVGGSLMLWISVEDENDIICRLTDPLGRTIPISITGSDGSYQIRHQATAPGVYTLTVTTSQGVQRKRVVLQ